MFLISCQQKVWLYSLPTTWQALSPSSSLLTCLLFLLLRRSRSHHPQTRHHRLRRSSACMELLPCLCSCPAWRQLSASWMVLLNCFHFLLRNLRSSAFVDGTKEWDRSDISLTEEENTTYLARFPCNYFLLVIVIVHIHLAGRGGTSRDRCGLTSLCAFTGWRRSREFASSTTA